MAAGGYERFMNEVRPNLRSRTVPISDAYRNRFSTLSTCRSSSALGMMTLDGGDLAHICGISVAPFWCSAAVVTWRRPLSPSEMDLRMLPFGYLLLVVFAFLLVHFFWHLRGFDI
jgi:hypothetical protein